MIRSWLASWHARLRGAAPPPSLTPLTPAARVDGALAEFAAAESKSRTLHREGLKLPPSTLPGGGGGSGGEFSPPTHPDASLIATLASPDATLQKTLTGSALGALAFALHAGKVVPRDVPRATRLWVFAASKNHLPSVLAVALASCDGLGLIPRDWERAEALLVKLSGPEVAEPIPAAKFALATLLLRKLAEGGGGGGEAQGGGSRASPAFPLTLESPLPLY